MPLETILPGQTELGEDDPVNSHLIDLRTRLTTRENIEAIIEELKWYLDLRDRAESVPDDGQIVWKELHRTYGNLSDDQISNLIHRLDESETGDYINQ